LDQRTVFYNLLYFADDVISIHEDTADSRAGSVSLNRATDMFAGIKKSLLATAHFEIKPLTHHPRLDKADAEQFIDRCRFGQTRRSSYVMTVACPLNAVIEGANPHQEELPFLPPFTRRVTTRLMVATKLLTDAAEREDLNAVIGIEDSNAMISANLCDALAQLAPTDPAGKLEFACSWAKKSH
jgi:hypothetical protein